MPVILHIALKHLLSRKRQSLVSLIGIVLGVGFFLGVSSLMVGSERDFIRRMIDNSPHITLKDEFREAKPQPLFARYAQGAVELRHVKPKTERRGIRNYKRKLAQLEKIPGLRAAAVLAGEAVASYAGKDLGITLNGFEPASVRHVSAIESQMTHGTLDVLETDPDGIIIGEALAKKFNLEVGNRLTVAAANGTVRLMKVVGLFSSGRRGYDEGQGFALLKKVQALLDKPNKANSFIFKLEDPYQATALARRIEGMTGYLAESWQEASADILNTLMIRNIIMYAVVSAILIVAAFGIYNIISTIVMEKNRDIAILKSMGYRARDIQGIFLIQGVVLGVTGSVFGCLFGAGLIGALGRISIKSPFQTGRAPMPLAWDWTLFAIAVSFALLASAFAAWLPARKAGNVRPVMILRGAA